MAKQMTLWEIALAVVLVAVGCTCGLAVAKDKLVLKYLPVDHDIETIMQNTTINLTETPLSPEDQKLIKDHNQCLNCTKFDADCPACCLYEYDNETKVHCQDRSDTACPKTGKMFNSTCDACANCTSTYEDENCGSCTPPCAKDPAQFVPCYKKGCPASTQPNDPTCKWEAGAWYCHTNNTLPYPACEPLNHAIERCNYSFEDAYTTNEAADSTKCSGNPPPSKCYEYKVKTAFTQCVNNCKTAVEQWGNSTYDYYSGMYGNAVCPRGNCTSGFKHGNCDAGICDKKIDQGCMENYTRARCVPIETRYRKLILGESADAFKEIDEKFRKKFVARSGEKYMFSWQVLCEVVDPDDRYNLYTMIKVLDQKTDDVVYQSIVHQKALGSAFFINAQTGLDTAGTTTSKPLKPGHSYVIKLYYFLPNDGVTALKVKISEMQMILYRTKN